MNRRSFFKVVTGFVAGIFATSAKSEPKYSCSSSTSGHPSATNTVEPKSGPPDGAYIKTSELKCLRCGYITKLPSGYYEFGTRVVCNCGSTSRFVAFAEVVRFKSGEYKALDELVAICN